MLIEVKAAGMNFRDVLKALALYPGEAPDARIFGDEVAGIVQRSAPESLMSSRETGYLASRRSALPPTPSRELATCAVFRPGLSFEEAATLPVVFMTAWHALKNVARMRAGERILIHAGAGGVGMAAIQIAQQLGAEVIASAGSPVKRAVTGNAGSQTRDRLAAR